MWQADETVQLLIDILKNGTKMLITKQDSELRTANEMIQDTPEFRFTVSDCIRSRILQLVSLLVTIMDSAAVAQAEKLIPAEVRMYSGCQDKQTSADGKSKMTPSIF